ncbi:NAD(P)H-dependent oxidoreductase [Aeromicrobium sp. UC242_57]|uniref:NAD(P)H-dependent oxidoreductase n=1 Tax=Aeromicrobium sp. UC242_57 TaxID=3374624 RepID=UPI0037B88511
MNVAVVVGNPKPRSRTWDAAHRVAEGLGGQVDTAIDVVDLGPGLLGWGDPAVKVAVEKVAASDLVVIASPTFKATYTGLLKLFLDQFAGSTGLEGSSPSRCSWGGAGPRVVAGAAPQAGAGRPGATVPAPALYLVDSAEQPDPVEVGWLERWAPVVRAAAGATA